MNTMNNISKEMRLAEIEDEIRKAEGNKGTACILMVISLFFLWPLLIVGGVMYSKANKKIDQLNEEKRMIMFQDYFSESNQQSV